MLFPLELGARTCESACPVDVHAVWYSLAVAGRLWWVVGWSGADVLPNADNDHAVWKLAIDQLVLTDGV